MTAFPKISLAVPTLWGLHAKRTFSIVAGPPRAFGMG
jgi:hypothetical protein